MRIAYYPADDIKILVTEVVQRIPLHYIDPERIFCFRSRGSKSRRGLARCYSLIRIWQRALDLPSYYLIEVISERYDRLSEEEKTKVIIHELLHIPKTFGGGLRPHAGYVTRKTIEEAYCKYLASKSASTSR